MYNVHALYHTRTHVHAHVRTHTHTRTHVRTHARTHTRTHTHTHTLTGSYQTVSIEHYAKGWSQSAVIHLHRLTVLILHRVVVVSCKRVRRVIPTFLQGAGGRGVVCYLQLTGISEHKLQVLLNY